MSAHVLLNLSNEWGKEIKCEAFYLLYDIKITLKSHVSVKPLYCCH